MLVITMGMMPGVLEATNILKIGEIARKCQAGKASACNELTKTALEDRMPGVRASAAGYLSDQSVLARIALEDPIPLVRGAAVQKLTDLALLVKIAVEDKDANVRGYASQSDVRLRAAKVTRAVEPLIACMKDPDSRIRAAAADSLGKTKDPRALDPLVTALRDNSPDVQRSAGQALGEIGAPAVEPLINALRDPTWSVRYSAAVGLSFSKDSRAVEPLIGALKDTDSAVRRSAAEALGQFQDPRAVEPLRAARQDPDSDVRLFAADALGEPRGEYVIHELAKVFVHGCSSGTDVTLLPTGSPGVFFASGKMEFPIKLKDVSGPWGLAAQAKVTGLPLSLPDPDHPMAANAQYLAWCPGARHTLETVLEIAGYKFASDLARPLVFRVQENGYVFENGQGTVTSPSNHTVHLSK
jgi:HEAT repeat protein